MVATAPSLIYRDSHAEVWVGDCLLAEHVDAIMGDRFATACLVDAPYSDRTHRGHADGKVTSDRARAWTDLQSRSLVPRVSKRPAKDVKAERRYARHAKRRDINYPPWSSWDVECFVSEWSPRCGWLVSITDHELERSWSAAAKAEGRVVFAPLPLVETGSRVRMVGDGPSSWTCWCAVSRQTGEPWSKWGTLRGAYVVPGERRFNSDDPVRRIMGGKPLVAMIQLVEDYSRRGDLVVDPTCGAGTTLMAAKMRGRRSIGIEKNPATAELAARNLEITREQLAMGFAEVSGEQLLAFPPTKAAE